MSELPSHIYRLESGELKYKTDFMHLFGLPEVNLVETSPRYVISSNEYVDMCVNMFMYGLIKIPHLKVKNGRGLECFDFKKDFVEISLHLYGSNCHILGYIKPKHLINYDMTKIAERTFTTIHFNWDKYKNRKGIIDDIGKLKFLNDLLTHKTKTNATSKR